MFEAVGGPVKKPKNAHFLEPKNAHFLLENRYFSGPGLASFWAKTFFDP